MAIRELFKYQNIHSLNDIVLQINYFSRSWSQDGGSGQAPPSFNSVFDLLMFIPKGTFTALFRPLPGEINNLFGMLAGLENLVVLLLVSYSLFNIKNLFKQYPPVGFMVGFIFIWSLFYGFISYQNLGTAFRFRLQVLPLLLMIFVLTREMRLKQLKSP